MSQRDTGGSAFPVLEEYTKFNDNTGQYDDYYAPHGGMSLRDYFAAKALPAIIEQNGRSECYAPDLAAKEAYDYADAMLTERQK